MKKNALLGTVMIGSLFAVMTGLAACGDDETGTNATTTSGTTTTSASTGEGPGSTGTGGAGQGGAGQGGMGQGGMGQGGMGQGGMGEGGAGGAGSDLAQCLQNAGDSMCSQCACNECLDEVKACNADMGCTEIRKCAQEKMCTGAGCFGPCGDVIMMYPNSVSKATTLSNCVEMNCAMQCM